NLENLLLAIAIAHESGVDPLVIANSLPALTGAPGRLERIKSEKYLALVDYAHTPDAVTSAIAAVKDKGTRIIAVLGCGGDRDSSKRALMGAALNEGADIPIFTSDNPRSEDPAKILSEMTDSLKLKSGGEIIVDRKAAINRAVELAQPGDLILILGKGHETGQEINGVKIPFSDREVLLSAIKARG
ncbi:MAG: glutamate ligase domain-containing protein, partial [Actinomycetota bacterium]